MTNRTKTMILAAAAAAVVALMALNILGAPGEDGQGREAASSRPSEPASEPIAPDKATEAEQAAAFEAATAATDAASASEPASSQPASQSASSEPAPAPVEFGASQAMDALDEQQRAQAQERLAALLDYYDPESSRRIEFVGEPRTEGDHTEIYAASDNERYVVTVDGSKVSAYQLNWHVEGVNDEEYASLPDYSGDDAHGQYHSTQTPFDGSKAWPLSNIDEVGKLVGPGVAASIFSDVNDYLAPAGMSIDDPAAVMVSEEGIERAEGQVSFRIQVAYGNDRLVIDCVYGDDTVYELMP